MMTVAERIQHVEVFLGKMVEKRSEVVKLLMWEIGKSQKDSEKEFDRTCDYIVDTINALKDLDRSHLILCKSKASWARSEECHLVLHFAWGLTTIRSTKHSLHFFRH